GLFSGGHTYLHGGIYNISVTVTDNDGGQGTGSTTAAVSGVGLVNGTLYVIGTSGPDDVQVDLVGHHKHGGHAASFLRVAARFDQGPGHHNRPSFAEFDPKAVSRLVIITGAGNDHVVIHRKVTISAFVLGGPGRDYLQGGSGNDVLVGGDGN